MVVNCKKFNENVRSQRSEQLLIVLSLETITTGLIDVIYALLENYSLKVGIVYRSKIYSIIDIYSLLKKEENLSDTNQKPSVVESLKFVHETIFANKEVNFDTTFDIIVITDETYIEKDSKSALTYKILLDNIKLSIQSLKRLESFDVRVSIQCILFNISVEPELLNSYKKIYENKNIFLISKKKSQTKSLEVLRNSLKIILTNISLPHTIISQNVELSFTQYSDMKVSCNIHSLSKTSLNVAGYSYKTKNFDIQDLEQKEIVTMRAFTDINTAEVVAPSSIKPFLETYDGTFLEQEKVNKIFAPQIILGRNEDVTEHAFISVQGFVPIKSLNHAILLGNCDKTLELVPTNEKYTNSVQFLNTLKESMIEKELAIICLAKVTWNGGVRNHAIIPKKVKFYDKNLQEIETVKLFMVDIPFNDEVRQYPKIGINQDYKTSSVDQQKYDELKDVFNNIYVAGKLNLKNHIDTTPELKLKQILASCDVDVQTKRYNIVLKDSVLKAKKMYKLLTEEDEILKQDIEYLDSTIKVVKESTALLLQNHSEAVKTFNDIKGISSQDKAEAGKNKTTIKTKKKATNNARKRKILDVESLDM
ncbi:hypothetical protein QEN19_003730 [Hanseniaspora menglaensis]